MTGTLAQRWRQVQREVADACRTVGRDPAEVSILPVSKTFNTAVVREAAALGIHRFGENKIQEIRDKSEQLTDLSLQWSMIGHLQTNKVGLVARLADELQSLDRPKLAAALDRRLAAEDRTLEVLVQVKTADEPSKYGLAPEALPAFLDELAGYPTLRVRGLMTIALHTTEPTAVRACFARLRELRDAATDRGHDLPRLSMGMSADFPLAIAEGATEVRIGTAIFGHRDYGEDYYWPEAGRAT